MNWLEAMSAKGYLIVSGLARGIDGAAHKAALEGGPAAVLAAVLASGLDHIYPQEHASLYEAISERGLLISENAFGANANARDFPVVIASSPACRLEWSWWRRRCNRAR